MTGKGLWETYVGMVQIPQTAHFEVLHVERVIGKWEEHVQRFMEPYKARGWRLQLGRVGLIQRRSEEMC